MLIASGNSARLWDISTGAPIGPVWSHQGPITAVAFGLAGTLALTGGKDGFARLWDVPTGLAIGPPLPHRAAIDSVAFRSDGRVALTAADAARLWVLAAAEQGPAEAVVARVEARTGQTLHPEPETFLTLNAMALARESGPAAGGVDLAARRRDWHVRQAAQAEWDGRWQAARWHLGHLVAARRRDWTLLARRARAARAAGDAKGAEADEGRALAIATRPEFLDWLVHAEYEAEARRDWQAARDDLDRLLVEQDAPLNLRLRRGTVRARLGSFADAAEDLGVVVAASHAGLVAFDTAFDYHRALLLIRAGDLEGYRASCEALLAIPRQNFRPEAVNLIAWCCALGPGAVAARETPVELAEAAVGATPADRRAPTLNTLGAVLYRAGKPDQAIDRLKEGIRRSDGQGTAQDWAFLALAYLARGDAEGARPWIDRLARRQPSTDPVQLWDELEIEVLRREVEAAGKAAPVPSGRASCAARRRGGTGQVRSGQVLPNRLEVRRS
ncbi:MAG TPA: hypothetical protein VG406_09550 [Isosphaeraceae bacterium]|nr:hypothetical protein [Isosphaeraceae bacterium]